MNTKSLILAAVALGLSTAAQAAPKAKLNCKATDPQAVVEALRLSPNGKEIEQIAPAAILATKLVIGAVSVKGTDAMIAGAVVDIEPRACAGSCPQTTFRLNASNREIYPNSSIVYTTTGFDERAGRQVTTTREERYICDVSGFQTTPAQVIKANVVRIDGKVQKMAAGVTTIDKVKKTIKVSVTTNLCPPRLICVAGPITQTYEVPLQNVNNDGCASYTTGSKDDRPVDGWKATVSVEDNSNNTCEVGGMVESIYLTTLELEGVNRSTGQRMSKTIELLNKKK